ncbi:MAG TPA: alternative ribosome rescue aminoacyl-tRNA hydrolase ArfB [Caldilineaceae bacterium]|nr:alternative ribosome rescue aminoacyl-tRNA hydrolase ArfB [Caldilineaceae bacterium]
MLEVTPTILIDESELHEEFVRSSGPGGQNVNKVASAVQLRFDIGASSALPEGVKRRLRQLAGNRVTNEDVLIIEANQERSQLQNRESARAQLVELIQQAAVKPKKRRKTQPTFAAKQRRLKQKRQRSEIKKQRRRPPRENG